MTPARHRAGPALQRRHPLLQHRDPTERFREQATGFRRENAGQRHVTALAPKVDNKQLVHHLLLFQTNTWNQA